MAKVNYNYDTFAEDINTLGQASSKLSLLEEKFDLNKYPNLDVRIKRLLESKYETSKIGTAAKDTAANINNYNNWLLEANQSAKDTENSVKQHAQEISPEAINSTLAGENTGTTGVSTDGDGYQINSQTLSELPSEVQSTIKESLKAAGYTDDQINKILNGEQTIDKKTLGTISSDLSKVSGNNNDVKNKVKEVLGNTVFNDDNTINEGVLTTTLLSSTGAGIALGADITSGKKIDTYGTDGSKENKDEESEESTSVGSILSKFGKGISKIIPETVSVTENMKTGNASLIASGISLVGASGATAVLAHKNHKVLEFSKKDFDSLDKFTRTAFMDCLKTLGCTKKEVETIMTSTYRIYEEEITAHKKNIKKAEKLSYYIGQDIYSIYKFTFYGVENEIDNFKLFLIMIIDGINISDKYNFYNILNRVYKNKNDINMIYTGINYLDYIVGSIVK